MYKLFILIILATISSITQANEFKLTSTDILDGKNLSTSQVFNEFGCKGENISPQLQWSGAPTGTKSFAVTVYDPDAPTGSGWWHWTVVNIPANVTTLPKGASTAQLPSEVIQGRTDFGSSHFGGACPPVGDKPHHYQFTVWALKVEKLPIDNNASGAMVGYMLHANVLAKSQITALYGR